MFTTIDGRAYSVFSHFLLKPLCYTTLLTGTLYQEEVQVNLPSTKLRPHTRPHTAVHVHCRSIDSMLASSVFSPRAQTVLIRRDREIRIFGYFSFFMHARIISECDFQTIHLKIIMHKMAILCIHVMIWSAYELFSGDLGPVRIIFPGPVSQVRVRADIIGHARINMYVGKSQSCMV